MGGGSGLSPSGVQAGTGTYSGTRLGRSTGRWGSMEMVPSALRCRRNSRCSKCLGIVLVVRIVRIVRGSPGGPFWYNVIKGRSSHLNRLWGICICDEPATGIDEVDYPIEDIEARFLSQAGRTGGQMSSTSSGGVPEVYWARRERSVAA